MTRTRRYTLTPARKIALKKAQEARWRGHHKKVDESVSKGSGDFDKPVVRHRRYTATPARKAALKKAQEARWKNRRKQDEKRVKQFEKRVDESTKKKQEALKVKVQQFEAKAVAAKPKRKRVVKEKPKPLQFQDMQSAEEVADALRTKYEWLKVVSFESDRVSIAAARQIGKAVDDMLTKYPKNNLTKIQVKNLPNDRTIAQTGQLGDGSCYIDWNESVSNQQHWNPAQSRRWHPPGYDENPWYHCTVHEFGHVLDFTAQMQARTYAIELLSSTILEDFNARHEKFDNSKMHGWLLNNAPSIYSLDADEKFINPTEAIAEGFVDVEMNGDKARKLSKSLHSMLLSFVAKSRPKVSRFGK